MSLYRPAADVEAPFAFPIEQYEAEDLSTPQGITGMSSLISDLFEGQDSNFEVVGWLPEDARARRLAKGVGQIRVKKPNENAVWACTGMLISETHVLTAGHCFKKAGEKETTATEASLRLGNLGESGETEVVLELELQKPKPDIRVDPASSLDGLDYAVIALKPDQYQKARDAGFKEVELGITPIGEGFELWLLHHPDAKELMLTQRLCQAQGSAQKSQRFRHSCDTLPSSSGGPVFSAAHELVVGLHVCCSRLGASIVKGWNRAVSIEAIAEVNTTIARLATRDPLTGRQSRIVDHAEERALQAERERAAGNHRLALFLALDGFKDFPEEGTAEHDFLLKKTSGPLATLARIYNEIPDRVMVKHDGPITSAQLSPNEDRILTTSEDGTARVWDAKTGKELGRQEHSHYLDRSPSAVFDATGDRVLSWGRYGHLRVWDAKTGTEICRQDHEDRIGGASFDITGKHVFSWGRDKVQIWEAGTATNVASHNHGGEIRGVVFDPEGRRALSLGVDGIARVWNATTGAVIAKREFKDYRRGIQFDATGNRVLFFGEEGPNSWHLKTGITIEYDGYRLFDEGVFDSSGSRILSWGYYSAAVLDASTKREIARQAHAGIVFGARFDPTGTRVLSWADDGTARVWDAKTGAEISRQNHGEDSSVLGATFDSTGKRVLSWEDDGTVNVWDAFTGTLLSQKTIVEGVSAALFDSSGDRILTWHSHTGIASVWDALNGIELVHQIHSEAINDAQFNQTGDNVLSWSDDGTARIWDVKGGDISRNNHRGIVNGARFIKSGQNVLSWGYDGTARVWDATTGLEIARHDHEADVSGARFDVTGTRVLSWGRDGTARVWDATTGVEFGRQDHSSRLGIDERTARYILTFGNGWWVRAALDATGERVLSWGEDGTVRVWNAADGTELARRSHGAEQENEFAKVIGASFDATGDRVLSWGSKGKVLVWNSESGEEIARHDHEGVIGATFNAAGTLVISWGSDGTARVWDSNFGYEIARQDHGRSVSGAMFNFAGTHILSWGFDGTARVWDASSGTELARQNHEDNVKGAVFDAAGARVLSWGSDGTALLWDSVTGNEIGRQFHGRIRSVSVNLLAFFSATGNRVFSSGVNDTSLVWDAKTGEELARQNRGVAGAVFGTESTLMLSWSGNVAWVWDATTGVVIASKDHGRRVRGARFDPSHSRILSWGQGGAARVWRLPPVKEKVLAHAWTREKALFLLQDECKKARLEISACR